MGTTASLTSFGVPLTGLVPKGFTLGTFAAATTSSPMVSYPLASKVPGALSVPGTTVNSTNVYGSVGSEAQILASTTVAGSDATVSMAWRPRNAYESAQTLTAPPGETLPVGSKWLTSDVLNLGITGGASTPVYAMQMSFDNRINEYFDPTGGSAADEFSHGALYLGELDSGQWKKCRRPEPAPGWHGESRASPRAGVVGRLPQLQPHPSVGHSRPDPPKPRGKLGRGHDRG